MRASFPHLPPPLPSAPSSRRAQLRLAERLTAAAATAALPATPEPALHGVTRCGTAAAGTGMREGAPGEIPTAEGDGDTGPRAPS